MKRRLSVVGAVTVVFTASPRPRQENRQPAAGERRRVVEISACPLAYLPLQAQETHNLMPVNFLTPEREAAAEALFAQLPRQAPVFMVHFCRFLDDPLNLKAFAPASARVLECPELRELGVALKQDITACNDNFVLAFEAAWVLSRIATERRDCLEEAHDVHAGQWATLRRRLLATLADTADHYGAGRLFNTAIGRRVRRASTRGGAAPILDWEKAEAACRTLSPAALRRRMTSRPSGFAWCDKFGLRQARCVCLAFSSRGRQ